MAVSTNPELVVSSSDWPSRVQQNASPPSPAILEGFVKLPVELVFHCVCETTGNRIEVGLERRWKPGWVVHAHLRLRAPLTPNPVSENRYANATVYKKLAAGPFGVQLEARVDLSQAPETLWDGLARVVLGLPSDLSLAAALSSWDAWRSLPRPVVSRLTEVLGPVRTAEDLSQLCEQLKALEPVARRLTELVQLAAGRKLQHQLARCWARIPEGAEVLRLTTPEQEESPPSPLALASFRQGFDAAKHIAPRLDPASSLFPPAIVIEVWLPVWEKRRSKARLTELRDCRCEVDTSGLIHFWPQDAADPYEEELTRGILLTRYGFAESQAELVFRDSRAVPVTLARHAMPWILQNDNVIGQVRELLVGLGVEEPLEICLDARLPVAELAIWRQAPRERTSEHYALFLEVSQAIQRLLRCWLPYFYLSRAGALASTEAAYAMWAYRAGKPCAPTVRTELTYDPMSPASVRRALQPALRSISTWLAQARELARELCPEAEMFYSSRQAERVRSMLETSKHFRALLALESLIVRELVHLGNWARASDANPSGRDSLPLAWASKCARAIAKGLRHTYPACQWSSLGLLVLLVATAAFRKVRGCQTELKYCLRLRTGGMSWTWEFSPEIPDPAV